MTKRFAVVLMLVAIVSLLSSDVLFAADQKTATPAIAKQTAKFPPVAPARPNLSMINGTIVSIDSADQANVKLTVKNDADSSVKTISVTPWTNITKVTDVAELKVNEPVRIMTRKVEDKDVAMGIMFGKIRRMPSPPVPMKSVAPNVKETPKK